MCEVHPVFCHTSVSSGTSPGIGALSTTSKGGMHNSKLFWLNNHDNHLVVAYFGSSSSFSTTLCVLYKKVIYT